jgi:arginyl-tRNA synthetase
VTLCDVVSEVGADVTRFVMLTRKNDAPLDFDFDKVMEQSKDNPVFYVQYAHARASSVLARAAEAGFETDDGALAAADLAGLGAPGELAVVRKAAEWPRQVEIAAANHEPHRIAFYLYDLASDFHALQHQGKLEPSLRFIREDAPALTHARLALVRATQVVIASGLGILGVETMTEMR